MIKGGIVTVYVSDLNRSVEFYTKTLGLGLKMHIPGHWAQVESPGLSIGLHPSGPKSPRPGISESLMIGFLVDKMDLARGELVGKGVKFKGDVLDDGQLLIAHFSDPDGNPLYLSQLTMKW